MKKYLKYLGYGFLTLISYYFINLLMAILTLGFYSVLHDEIYGTFVTPRKPGFAITLFVIVCISLVLILLGFFFFGRALIFRNEKMLFAFILFIIPNIALQNLIYNSYSIELMCLLNWFFAPFADVFFYDTETHYDLYYSYFWNSVLTYLPFISAFIGGLTKRKKEFSRLGR